MFIGYLILLINFFILIIADNFYYFLKLSPFFNYNVYFYTPKI